jgi:hypothetical protein
LIANLLIIPTVKAAVEALRYADIAAWDRLFTSEAELYDDGSPRDLKNLTQEVFGREYCAFVDKIANNGLCIEGEFRSSKWGDFITYFNFDFSDAGRIVRLDIGRVELPLPGRTSEGMTKRQYGKEGSG